MDHRPIISKTDSTAGSLGLLFLRLIPFSILFAFHGWGKVQGAIRYLFEGSEWMFIGAVEKLGFPYPVYFATGAALAESLFCILLIFGILTRFSAAVVTLNFGVAVYNHLITDLKFETAALYFASALALFFLGAGRFSLDAVIKRRRLERHEEYPEDVAVPVSSKRYREVERVPEHSREVPSKPEPPLR